MQKLFWTNNRGRCAVCHRRWISAIAAVLVPLLMIQGNASGCQNSPAASSPDNKIILADRLIQSERQRIDSIAAATRATVGVFGNNSQGGGSGVIISADGFALTNYHVVESNGPFMKCSSPDGNLYDAVIVGIDPTGDVALIKLLGRDDFPAAKIGNSDQVQVGANCFVIGNPFLLATNFQPSVAAGIVSGVHRYQYPAGTLLEYADCIQTDAAINPGNSGGALFNAAGELIGINGRGSFEKRGRVNVGVGYAISINQIKHFLDHLKSGRLVDHATLGARVASDDQGAVRVDDVLEISDAFRKGLRYDDEIISFGGRPIRTVNQFKNALGIFPKGYRVPIVFVRDDQRFEAQVRLAGVHVTNELVEMVQGKPRTGLPQPPGQKPPSPPQPKPKKTPQQDADGQSAPPANPYADLFESRSGYSNYYFNRTIRDRIWQQFKSFAGDFGSANRPWRINGQTDQGKSFSMVLGVKRSGVQIGDEAFVLDDNEDFSDQLAPPDSNGFLVALHHWRRLLTGGIEKYGEVFYLGSLPMEGLGAEKSDVLVATSGVIEANFMFDKSRRSLTHLEMVPELNFAPCEVRFSNYQPTRFEGGEVKLPMRISYRSNIDGRQIVFEVKRYQLSDRQGSN